MNVVFLSDYFSCIKKSNPHMLRCSIAFYFLTPLSIVRNMSKTRYKCSAIIVQLVFLHTRTDLAVICTLKDRFPQARFHPVSDFLIALFAAYHKD